MKSPIINQIIDILLILFGNFLIALSVVCFVIPNEILSGGLAGLVIALHPIFQFLDISNTISILTILLFVFGIFTLGKKFVIKTLISTISYPIFLNLLTDLCNDLIFVNNEIIASIYSGLLFGLGTGIVFRTRSSTGGMDIPALLMEKYLHIPLSKACLILDSFTVLLGLTTRSLEAVLIGLIFSYSSSVMIDKILSFGGSKTKSILVISNKYEEILERISSEIDRGATLIYGQGSYTRKDIKIVLCVVDNKQYPRFNQIVSSIDENAFSIVQNAHEVRGYGFSFF